MLIALVQQKAGEDLAENRRRGLEAVETAATLGARIIGFAELAFDPFYPAENATPDKLALAEPVPGPTTEMFAECAARLRVVVILNLFERDGDRTFDTSPVIDADGSLLGTTRMIHIADIPCFREKGYYTPGDHGAPVYKTAYGHVGVAICYDRHFPEYMRALALGGAELVFVPQAGAAGEFPDGLLEAEMRAAAFQNGYFIALCNRVGKEPSMTFAGGSFVCDPEGYLIDQAGPSADEILLCSVNIAKARGSQARRLFLRDRRPELYGDWLKK